jgi:CHAT domain-containing protein
MALARLGQRAEALRAALDAEQIGRDHLRLTLQYLSERQALAYAAKRPKGFDLALSLSGKDRESISPIFDALIRGRALTLDEMATRGHGAADAAQPDVAPLWTALISARQRLANLVVRGPSEQRPEQYLSLIEDARREKELAERALAEKSAAFRAELERSEVGLNDVRAALADENALVAFVRYDRTMLDTPSARTSAGAATATPFPLLKEPVPSYVAFVLRASRSDISVVPLGPASVVDGLVARWRAETATIVGATSPTDAEKSYRAAGAALRRRIWNPLREYLAGATTVFVVPDGTLNLVSLAALPVGTTRYLIDQGPVIHYLSAERDLVASPLPSSATRGLLAVGGAAFNDATLFAVSKPAAPLQPTSSANAVASLRAVSSDTLRAGCGTLQTMQFTPLAGTSREVRDVAALWMDSPAQVLEGRGASEQAFKRAAPGHRVLHLATHGFFLGNDCTPVGAATRSVGGLTSAQAKPASRPRQIKRSNAALSENPLLMSGLALAGANRRTAAGPDEDDGILTAEEVTALNLDGVEWAVLSACDTGLGEVKAGEGVFGLRRAFQMAGVRTVIMSLWPVDDQATRVWMRALYQGRLQKRLSTADAMHEASLSVLRARRARGQSTHPFYWAAFVAAGDWR